MFNFFNRKFVSRIILLFILISTSGCPLAFASLLPSFLGGTSSGNDSSKSMSDNDVNAQIGKNNLKESTQTNKTSTNTASDHSNITDDDSKNTHNIVDKGSITHNSAPSHYTVSVNALERIIMIFFLFLICIRNEFHNRKLNKTNKTIIANKDKMLANKDKMIADKDKMIADKDEIIKKLLYSKDIN